MSEKASATLQKQFEALQEQQAQKLARRKQRAEGKGRGSGPPPSGSARGPGMSAASTRSQLSTAASNAFGIDDDLGLELAPAPAHVSAREEQQGLKEQIRELKDETGRLYKLLSERDLEVRQLRKKNDQQKAVLETAGSGTNETAALKIVELSKKVRDMTAELEAEKTRSKQWARKCMDMENDKQKNDLNNSGRNHGTRTARGQEYSHEDIKASLEADLKALQKKFNDSEQKGAELRNQVHEVKQELKMTQKVLANEVGEGVTVQSLLNTPSGWRGRAQQVLALQKKVTELKAQVNMGTSTVESVMGDDLESQMMGITSARKTTANDAHREQIRKMERERKDAQQKMINELRALEQDQEASKNKLDAAKARNKVLAGEIKSVKAQLATLLDKGKHDDELISALMKQQEELQKLIKNSSNMDQTAKNEYEKKIKELQQKAHQDVNLIAQLNTVVSDKEKKISQLEEQMENLKVSNMYKAQADGVTALFERTGSRASTVLSNLPEGEAIVVSSPTPPPSSSNQMDANLRESNLQLSSVTPTGVPLFGPVPQIPTSRQSDRVSSAALERPPSGRKTSSPRDHPTNSSGDPGAPQITAEELQELHAQIQQYRSLAQAAEVERDKLAELVKVLQQRIGESTQRMADAQQEVQTQKRRQVALEKQLGKARIEQASAGSRTSGKRSSRVRGSTTTLHELIDEESESAANLDELQTRLEIQQDENEALKAALQSTLSAKEEDLRMYHEIMDQTKTIFLQGLRQFRAQ